MKQIDLIVVDVGNSQCKAGLVHAEQLLDVYTLSLEDCAYQPWRHRQISSLLENKPRWVLSGSNPPIIRTFADWLNAHHQSLTIIDSTTPLPLQIDVDYPEKVGRDRLLNALAIETRPAIIISAGSAVTVDAIDGEGRFLGGAIFPGLRLMAKSLNQYTAKLPLVDARATPPPLPGKNTEQAIHAGIIQSVVGGIVGCVTEMMPLFPRQATSLFLTGGDADSLQRLLPWPTISSPTLALQGMIVASRTLWS